MLLAVPTQAQPSGYGFIQQFGKPCRLRPGDLPWQVYNTGDRHQSVLDHVLQTYNNEALALGLPPFFERTTVPQAANLIIDWTGAGLPPDKAAGVFWDANLGYRRVLGLSMDGAHNLPVGNRAQILMQEMGHVLGLGDSPVRTDVMHPVMHTRRYYRLSQAQLTERDRAALHWLYRLPEFVPILGRGQRLRPTSVAPSPQPVLTPLPLPR